MTLHSKHNLLHINTLQTLARQVKIIRRNNEYHEKKNILNIGSDADHLNGHIGTEKHDLIGSHIYRP